MSETVFSNLPSPVILNPRPRETPRVRIFRRFMRHRLAMAGLICLVVITLSTILATLSPYSPTDQEPTNARKPPSAIHWFGTDELGRDVFTRILYGGQISLFVGLFSTVLTIVLGILVGALSGYFGGFLDNILMRITDAFLGFPTVFVLILLASLLRAQNLRWLQNSVVLVIVIIAILSWMWPARLVRSLFLTLRERDFVTASHMVGAKNSRVIFLHILPNCIGQVFVSATLQMASAIITESGLSFLGFGVQAPTPSWGNILATAQTHAFFAPWLAIFPGLMIFFTVISINYIGDGLRDAFDPYSIQASK
jgi:peptide/nickel transport system permease protein